MNHAVGLHAGLQPRVNGLAIDLRSKLAAQIFDPAIAVLEPDARVAARDIDIGRKVQIRFGHAVGATDENFGLVKTFLPLLTVEGDADAQVRARLRRDRLHFFEIDLSGLEVSAFFSTFPSSARTMT